MTVEKIEKMPEIQGRVKMVFRDLLSHVKNAGEGETFKFVREDGKKVNAATLRKCIEDNTGKKVVVKKFDVNTAYVKVLSPSEAKKEEEERKKRAETMRKKLAGKQ